MIKNVLIDLDDTIFDFRKAEAFAIRQTLSEFKVEPTEETIKLYSRINQSQWERLERKEITRDEVRLGRFAMLFEALGVENVLPEKVQALYERNLSSYHFFIDGAQELLEKLCGKYNLYLASNGTSVVQDRRIGESGIAKYFKGIFISEKIGHNKPAKEFFDYCFERIEGFLHSETIIVGDSLSSDIKGGRNAGILTCRVNPKSTPCSGNIIPDYEIKSLDELPGLLASI